VVSKSIGVFRGKADCTALREICHAASVQANGAKEYRLAASEL
jgi:hypothetical protein